MNGRLLPRLVAAWSLLAIVLMFALPGTSVTFLVVLVFLLACPGIVVAGQLGIEDRAFAAMMLVASSLAIDAIVGETFVYLRLFTGARVVGVLAALAIAGAWLRRPVTDRGISGATALPLPRRSTIDRGGDLDFDRSMPVLLVRIGQYPVYHGGVCAIRSFGRVGVPVHAIVEDRLTPAAASRYLESAHVWRTSGSEPEPFLVDGLRRIGEELGTRALAIPTDDESAVLLAEHGDVLREHFLYPAIDPRLPRRLASKEGLHIMCRGFGIPQPDAFFPRTTDDVFDYAATARYPIVVKNVAPFARLSQKAVGGTTVVHDEQELLELALTFPSPRSVMFQEYVPREEAEDWIFQTYCDGGSNALVPFTGIKLRSWPPHAGVTTYARAVRNEELEDLSVRFCRDIGFVGVCDLDWRFDRRDQKYKLVDFNPRPGAQFDLFETEAGIDVVRALHLDLTGRSVPTTPARSTGIRIEHLDLPSTIAYRGGTELAPDDLDLGGRTDRAWVASDDPVPVLVMLLRFVPQVMRRAAGAIVRRPARLAVLGAVLAAAVIAGVVIGTSTSHGPSGPTRPVATAVSIQAVAPDTVTLAVSTTHPATHVRAVATSRAGSPTVLWAAPSLRAGSRVTVVVPFPSEPTTVTIDGIGPSAHPLHVVLDPATLRNRLHIECEGSPTQPAAACAWLGTQSVSK